MCGVPSLVLLPIRQLHNDALTAPIGRSCQGESLMEGFLHCFENGVKKQGIRLRRTLIRTHKGMSAEATKKQGEERFEGKSLLMACVSSYARAHTVEGDSSWRITRVKTARRACLRRATTFSGVATRCALRTLP